MSSFSVKSYNIHQPAVIHNFLTETSEYFFIERLFPKGTQLCIKRDNFQVRLRVLIRSKCQAIIVLKTWDACVIGKIISDGEYSQKSIAIKTATFYTISKTKIGWSHDLFWSDLFFNSKQESICLLDHKSVVCSILFTIAADNGIASYWQLLGIIRGNKQKKI